ncbi:MAG TPA: phage tail protein [Lysobacter sp.]|nr:phage tail protein [Lysobacter sp.]
MSYYSVLTTIGEQKLATAIAEGTTVNITEMALGDGGGAPVTPVENRAALVREVNRGPVGSLTQDPVNPSYLTAQRVIAPNVGGWTIREVGLFDADGDLLVYGNFPESYKPQLSEGSGKELIIKLVFEVASASAISLAIDPSVVLASRDYVDDAIAEATDGLASRGYVDGAIAAATSGLASESYVDSAISAAFKADRPYRFFRNR